jgi:hypothetical protein
VEKPNEETEPEDGDDKGDGDGGGGDEEAGGRRDCRHGPPSLAAAALRQASRASLHGHAHAYRPSRDVGAALGKHASGLEVGRSVRERGGVKGRGREPC